MAKRYSRAFQFVDTEDQAKALCDSKNSNNYIRRNHKAHYTPWTSKDKTESKYVVWYATR